MPAGAWLRRARAAERAHRRGRGGASAARRCRWRLRRGASARLDYGRVRLWGTVAFIVATLLGGRVLHRAQQRHRALSAARHRGADRCRCARLPRVATPATGAAAPSWRSLLDRRHLLFLAAATLIQSSHAVYYAFGTLYWQRLGISDATIAWLWAEGAIVEVAAVLLRRAAGAARSGRSALHGARRRRRAGALEAHRGRRPRCRALLALQPLHALTFAAAHLGAMHYLARAVPPSAGRHGAIALYGDR